MGKKTDLKDIKNKQKREMIRSKQKEDLKKDIKKTKKLKKDGLLPKQDPLTVESKRIITKDIILEDNPDLNEEENLDEFQDFIANLKHAKILLTTSLKPTRFSFEFLMDLKNSLPNSFYYPRKKYSLIQISKLALKRNFTHMIALNERNKKPYSLSISVLCTGPTFHFRVRKYIQSYKIFNKGNPTGHNPELILKNFNTAIGRRLARGLSSLYSCNPEFKGRTVVTFHNQRDFIFFRHHRYIFKDKGEGEKIEDRIKVDLQEIGPRFALQLQKVHTGCYDEFKGDYEYLYHADNYVERNKFYL